MKLNKTEKLMLILLILSALWFLSIRYFILPERAKMYRTTEMVRELESRKAAIDQILAQKDELEQRLEAAAKEPRPEHYFYEHLDSVLIDRLLQSFAADSGVAIRSFHIVREPALRDEHDTELDGSTTEMATETENSRRLMVSKSTVTLQVKGDADSIMELISSIYELKHSVVVSGLDTVLQGDELEGSLTVVFYSLDEESERTADDR